MRSRAADDYVVGRETLLARSCVAARYDYQGAASIDLPVPDQRLPQLLQDGEHEKVGGNTYVLGCTCLQG